MNKNFYAHTHKERSESNWQLLSEHLKQTAGLAEFFCMDNDLRILFKITGLLHDFGKYQIAFQHYLKNGGRRGCVPHAVWGAGYARLLGLNEISFVIDGHHKGLPDRVNWKADTDVFINNEIEDFQSVVKSFTADLGITDNELKINKLIYTDKFEYELVIRYLFSALTDADWLDTERFCNAPVAAKRKHIRFEYTNLINKLAEGINKKSKEGELNLLRNQAREYALSKSTLSPGFFSMNLPTGMGKTLTSVAWALEHMRINRLLRIIIVLPFTNIIDQTSQILKNIFGDEWVLEHHSGYNENISTIENSNMDEYTRRLACENWDYPIIVTTTVQFFESLFSNKPSKCRKIHNIAESVVIFDEVQTLPKELVLPTLTMLKNVQKIMRVSFLFCTATQPAFKTRKNFTGIDEITSLVENPSALFNKTRRVSYQILKKNTAIELVDLAAMVIKQHSAVLCIFNTKKAARDFFKTVTDNNNWDNVYHLSTAMCPHHRKSIIAHIRADLELKRKIIVSSTQLVEAGVDFDFPCVFREIAPLESIIQAAGRCNREGKMNGFGKVFLFKLCDAGMPGKLYRSSAEFTFDLIGENINRLYQHDFYNEYYQKIVNLFVDVDKKKINNLRLNFNYQTVAQSYRIIDSITENLYILNYNEESEQLLHKIEQRLFMSREDFRKMQQFSIQVFNYFLIQNKNLFDENKHEIKIWYGGYDSQTGISIEPVDSDSYIV